MCPNGPNVHHIPFYKLYTPRGFFSHPVISNKDYVVVEDPMDGLRQRGKRKIISQGDLFSDHFFSKNVSLCQILECVKQGMHRNATASPPTLNYMCNALSQNICTGHEAASWLVQIFHERVVCIEWIQCGWLSCSSCVYFGTFIVTSEKAKQFFLSCYYRIS